MAMCSTITDARKGRPGSALARADLRTAARVLLLALSFTPATVAGPPGDPRVPNDPMLGEQWYLFSPGDERGEPGSLGAIEAWRRIRPAPPVVVALLDAGVNDAHPDLAANIWRNERETPNGKDDDGDGYVDDLHGWDFAYADNSPTDRRSRKFPDQADHGTVLASLMAAVPDNGIGTAGVGRNIQVMNLRVFGTPEAEGETSTPLTTTLPAAIRYAIRHGARVVVCTAVNLDPPRGTSAPR
ncbi:S8 family serine peptidase [Paludisphaera soli]|uniref:S8 family serine peptidase n=1 Tax=Paludisphaera soli TaxID=2712865 RepID=UPI0013EB2735|nr:S8 family serine peptidase [Paludisphaera soli]